MYLATAGFQRCQAHRNGAGAGVCPARGESAGTSSDDEILEYRGGFYKSWFSIVLTCASPESPCSWLVAPQSSTRSCVNSTKLPFFRSATSTRPPLSSVMVSPTPCADSKSSTACRSRLNPISHFPAVIYPSLIRSQSKDGRDSRILRLAGRSREFGFISSTLPCCRRAGSSS